ncbi:hypothetical protein ACTFIV_009423 [Dictyostelium citrinum]
MEKNYINENSIYRDENEDEDEDDNYNGDGNEEIINEEYLIKKREKIETLFLYQNFQTVITELINLLYKLYGNNNSPLLSSIFNNNNSINYYNNNNNNEENNENLITTNTISLSNITFESFSKCYHNCQNDTNCQCRWIMELLIQSLYELGKPSDALKLVNRFYQDGISNTPINILILSIHLLVYLKSYNESKVIIIEALKRNRNEFKSDQYEQLIELLIFHVMFRINEINESISLLENDIYLSDWKKNGFIKALYEMVQIREFEEKNQRELQLKRETEKIKQQQNQQQQLEQQLEQQLINSQQQLNNSSSSSSSSSSQEQQQEQQLPITQSNIAIIKDIINESIHEILSIRDLKSLKLAINRVLFGNIKKLLYFVFNNFKLVYLKFKLFYLRNKLIIKRVLPMVVTVILFIIAVKRVSNSRNNNNNNNNNSNLINTKTLKQQQQQKLNSNNKRQFGIKNVQQQQPYRNSQQYQQYRQNNRSILNNNINSNNSNSTTNWGGFKQLLSNTFSFNRV